MAEKDTLTAADAVTQQGSTFAERAAVAAGKKVQKREVTKPFENSTFASRSGKAVKADDVEDKAVARKSVSKKAGK